MTDKEFLKWIYNRLIGVYEVHKNTDYMLRLKKIIDSMDDNK